MTRTCGDYQIFIWDLRTVGERDAIVFLVKTDCIAEDNLYIRELMQDPANRLCDLTRRKHSRRDLIQQRLENVMILTVYQRDIDRFICQRLSRPKPAKAAADDNNFWPFTHINR